MPKNGETEDHEPLTRQGTSTPPPMSRQETEKSGTDGRLSREITNASMARELTNTSTIDEQMATEVEKLTRPLFDPKPPATSNDESEASIVSRLLLYYLQPTLNKALELDSLMEASDLSPIIGDDRSALSSEKFTKRWHAEMAENPTNPNLLKVILQCISTLTLQSFFWLMIESAGPFTSVILLPYINDFVIHQDYAWWRGGLYASMLFAANFIVAIAASQNFRYINRITIRVTSYLQTELLRKVIHLSTVGQKQVSQGTLYQVFNGDCSRLPMMFPNLLRGFNIICQVVGAFIYMGFIAGWPACGAAFVFLCVLPFNYNISEGFVVLYIKKMIAGDKRTQKVVEIVNNVRVVKFYGWEKPFRTLIQKLRSPELDMIYELMKQLAFLMCSFSMAQPLIQVVLFILLTVKSENDLTVLVFFQCLSLTNILGMALVQLPFCYSCYLQVAISLQRLTEVYVADERPHVDLEPEDTSIPVGFIQITDGHFSFTKPEEAKKEEIALSEKTEMIASPASPSTESQELTQLNFICNPGDLVMVVGKVGSGKSSLVSAILADMIKLSGTLKRRGTIAYVPQSAWIVNATVRNNILMNIPYDRKKYERVLDAVDLRVDLLALPNGDLTEVGEKGINLSGGQKQRVSLARALYQDADIYLFDDPLSALDAHVGRHVFNEAICGLVGGKSRILVTHQMSYLPSATRIYLAHKMKVTEETVPSSISEATEGESELITMLRAWNETSNSGNPQSPSAVSPTSKKESAPAEKKTTKKKSSSGKLTVREERLSGRVSSATLFEYLRSFGGGGFWSGIILLNLFVVCCNIFSVLWMGFWTGNKYPDFDREHDSKFFLGIYAAAIGTSSIFVLCRELWWRHGAVNAPRIIYDKMLDSVLHAPMSFFDTTPVGRIINRFTKDSQELDFTLPMAANQVISLFCTQLGSMIAMCVILPYFSPIVAVVLLGLFFVQPTVATVVLRRLSSSTAGPVSSLFSETVGGATSIRSYGLTDFFKSRFAQVLDQANTARMADGLLFESIRCRVNILMAVLSASVMLIIMAMRSTLSPSDTSFCISQGMQVTTYMGYMMFQRGNLMLSLNSIERLHEYCALPREATGENHPEEEWPKTGHVELQNLSARYRPGLPLVLRNVNVHFQSGEKIGVCGRTGSGKSSLLLTLFRLIPFEDGSKLLIDGVDTSSISLDLLRGKLSAIPQEPVLFSGTVRENLDPFGTTDAATLTQALEMCHLVPPLQALLDTKAEKDKPADGILGLTIRDGDLSVGQKQLMCLARAVSRNVRVLVLDEATSSVDVHTDQLIQKTIRTAFKQCTVITVAHRLNTIMDSDRVLVLDRGEVCEFDAPGKLMENPESVFANLVAEAQNEEEESPL